MRIEALTCTSDMEDSLPTSPAELVVTSSLTSLSFNTEGPVTNSLSFPSVLSLSYSRILLSAYKDNVNNLRNIFSTLISLVRSLPDFNGSVEELLSSDQQIGTTWPGYSCVCFVPLACFTLFRWHGHKRKHKHEHKGVHTSNKRMCSVNYIHGVARCRLLNSCAYACGYFAPVPLCELFLVKYKKSK